MHQTVLLGLAVTFAECFVALVHGHRTFDASDGTTRQDILKPVR